MASVRELKTCWQIRFSDAGRSPPETTNSIPKEEYPTKTAAGKEAKRRQVLYDQGEYDPWAQGRPGEALRGEEPTLLEAVRRYHAAKKAAGERGERGGWSESTARRYKGTLEKFARDVGPGLLVSRLRTGQIRDWTTRPDLSEASRRTYHGILRAFVKWLEAEGIAEVDMPPPLQTRSTLPSYATPDELKKVCEAWRELATEKADANDAEADPTLWYIDAWRLAFWQALRKSEITALRCGAVDLDKGRIAVGDEDYIPKGKDERVIPLADPAREIAEKWMGEPGERLFRHRTPQYMAAAFTEARKKALPGKTGLSLHGLRHGRCIHLLEQGLRVHVVQRFMRHKSLDATMRYVQIADESLQEEIEDLGEEGLDV